MKSIVFILYNVKSIKKSLSKYQCTLKTKHKYINRDKTSIFNQAVFNLKSKLISSN